MGILDLYHAHPTHPDLDLCKICHVIRAAHSIDPIENAKRAHHFEPLGVLIYTPPTNRSTVQP